MPKYTGPVEVPATDSMSLDFPLGRQMGGLEPFESDEPLVRLLYLLLRDHVQCGVVERLMGEIEISASRGALLTNSYLGEYASNISERLIRATELRMKAQRGELHEAMTGAHPDEPERLPFRREQSAQAPIDDEHSREQARIHGRAAAEGRLRGWVNAPLTVPLARVIEQAFAAIGTVEEHANLSEVVETVTILLESTLRSDADD